MPKRQWLDKNFITGVCPSCLQTVSFSVYNILGGGEGKLGSKQLVRRILCCPRCKCKTNMRGRLFLFYNKVYDIPSIYTIYAMEDIGPSHHKGRTFGWYPYEEWAKSAVENNECDIHECSYRYVVIEEFEYGVFPIRKRELWYKWNGKKFVSIDKPKEENHIVNYGMG